MFLSLRNITKRFGTLLALNGVSLDIDEGEFVCFLGPSGCGKTTLLRVIAGARDARCRRSDARTARASRGVPARLRNFGIVFQSYSLFPNMSVARNIGYGLECRKWPKDAIGPRVAEVLALVHLPTRRRSIRISSRADSSNAWRWRVRWRQSPRSCCSMNRCPRSMPRCVKNCVPRSRTCRRALGMTTIMVTHDQHEAMEMADRIVVMNAGVIEQIGGAVDLYDQPGQPLRRRVHRPDESGQAVDGEAPGVDGARTAIRHRHPPRAYRADRRRRRRAADTLVGRIEKCVFLGSFTRITLVVDDQRLVLELRGRRTDLVPGAALSVRIPAARDPPARRTPRSDELRRRRLRRRAPRIDADRIAVFGLAVAVVVPLLVFVVVPLFGICKTSFVTPDGIGFGNYVRYFNSPKFTKVVVNSLSVSLTTTLITVVLAYAFAYAMRRTAMPLKSIFGAVALLPLFAPSLVQALGIVFLLGGTASSTGRSTSASTSTASGESSSPTCSTVSPTPT